MLLLVPVTRDLQLRTKVPGSEDLGQVEGTGTEYAAHDTKKMHIPVNSLLDGNRCASISMGCIVTGLQLLLLLQYP